VMHVYVCMYVRMYVRTYTQTRARTHAHIYTIRRCVMMTHVRGQESAGVQLRFCDVHASKEHGILIDRQGWASMDKCRIFDCACGVLVRRVYFVVICACRGEGVGRS